MLKHRANYLVHEISVTGNSVFNFTITNLRCIYNLTFIVDVTNNLNLRCLVCKISAKSSMKNCIYFQDNTANMKEKQDMPCELPLSHTPRPAQPHLPLSLPTPHTRMVWMGCVLSTVRFSGSTSLREPSSRSMKRSLP